MALNPLGAVGGAAIGIGVGGPIGAAVAPLIQALANDAWDRYQSLPLDPVAAASIVAEGIWTREAGRAEANLTGVTNDRFDALVEWVTKSPDLGTLLDLLRRGHIDAATFRHGLRDARLETRWLNPLLKLARVLVTPDQLANARQQGFETIIDLDEEARDQGVSAARLELLYQLSGNPPGPETALAMWRRSIITEAEFEQAIREGRTKTKYTDEYKALKQQVLTAPEYAGLWLRGWLTEAQAKAGGALTGYDAAAMDLLYKNRGRPATVRQAHLGFMRGGRLPEAGNDLERTIRRSVEQSNIRSEWFDILFAQRFTYPSAFVLRALATDGTFSVAETEQILIESGWKPEWAKAAAAKWGGAPTGPGTKWADRAKTRLFTLTHTEYLDESIDEATARRKLAAIGVPDAEQTTVVALWDEEAEIRRRELTPSQIRKAYVKTQLPEVEALARLEDAGMTPEDARIFLASG